MKKVKRLFNEFQPAHYDLLLEPNPVTLVFNGRVIIAGRKTGKPSKRITLHQKGLRIGHAKLIKHDRKSGDREIKLDRINRHAGRDELRLHSPEILYPGSYTITLEFSGKITEPMHGIYPSKFTHAGDMKVLIATQFESHHAREAFPCIDEPEAKATYDLTLKTPLGESVISNTPIKRQIKEGSLLVTEFEKTPKMSTYLLAFAFGEMIQKETTTKNGVVVRCFGTPHAKGRLDYSLGVAVLAIEFFENYFDTAYPLTKLDMLALPDFSSGAMENWGLITYRESLLLIDPKNSSTEAKQMAALVITHELAHQWFGNLVTMRWWDDLWLNESFANLMEYRAVDELFPEWNIFEQFVISEMNMAMRRDALPNVQSVRTTVNHPDEIGSLFDPAIVYAKGGNILNMMRHMIGEDAFRQGLSSYFKKYAYDNTSADDLWSEMAKSSNMPVKEFMHKWLDKPGYPVVEVAYDLNTQELALAQRRLVIGMADSKTTWSVPLAASSAIEPAVLDKKEANLTLAEPIKLLLFNHGAKSYFIPHYVNRDHFGAIIDCLKTQQIGTIDRLLLLMHGSILESAGITATTDNLEIVQALSHEQQESVWSAIAGVVGSARRLVLTDKKAEANLKLFVAQLSGDCVKRVGWTTLKTDTPQIRRLRSLVLGMAAGAEEPSVLAEGKRLFAKFRQPYDLPADIRGVVYYIGVRYGTDDDFQKLVELYISTQSADEKDEISSALASTKKPAHIRQLLELLSSDQVRAQDLPRWFAWLIRNQYAVDATWQWLKSHWSWVEEKYGNDKSYDVFPRYASMAFSRPEELKMYKSFFGPKLSEPALARTIKLGIEEIEGRIDWRSKNEAAVKKWLAGRI